MLWTLVGVIGVLARGALPARPPHAGPLRLHLRPGGPGPAGHPGAAAARRCPRRTAPRSGFELPGFSIQPAEFSKILLLIFFAAVLVAKREPVHQRGQALPRHGPAAAARPRAAAGGVDRVGRRDGVREGPRHVAAAVRVVPGAGLRRHRAVQLGGHRPGAVRRGKRCGVLPVRPRPGARADLARPVRRPRRRRLPDRAVAVRPRHRRHLRHRPRQRPARHRARRVDRLHHRRDRRGARPGRAGRAC